MEGDAEQCVERCEIWSKKRVGMKAGENADNGTGELAPICPTDCVSNGCTWPEMVDRMCYRSST